MTRPPEYDQPPRGPDTRGWQQRHSSSPTRDTNTQRYKETAAVNGQVPAHPVDVRDVQVARPAYGGVKDGRIAVFRDLDFDMFGRGGCWALAQAVHDLTGWPMRAFRHGGSPGRHVFVETPSGAFLDIRGATPRYDFLHQWGENADSVVPLLDTGDWTLPRWFNLRRWDRDVCLARAREVAPGLVSAVSGDDGEEISVNALKVILEPATFSAASTPSPPVGPAQSAASTRSATPASQSGRQVPKPAVSGVARPARSRRPVSQTSKSPGRRVP
jgi:hypothetical protein